MPCCKDCNQKKGAKYWYVYMKELINDTKSDKRNAFRTRYNNLEEYCKKNGLPINDQEISPNHKLSFEGNDELIEWWHILRKEVVNALDNAQLQIDAFKAGIGYSIRSHNLNAEECFKQYFAGLIKKEYTEIESAGGKYQEAEDEAKTAESKARKDAKAKRKTAENAKVKANAASLAKGFINNNTIDCEESELSIKKEEVKEYFWLVGYGFRLNEHDVIETVTDDAKQLITSANDAFMKGFKYAKSNDRGILKRCIDRGWLEDVIHPGTGEP